MKKKQRTPRKLKKGFRSIFKHRDTKWKRKAMSIVRKGVEGFVLSFIGTEHVEFEPGGIVSDKPVSKTMSKTGEYVIGKDEQEWLRALLQQPPRESIYATINLDDMSIAMKKRMLRDITR